MSPATSLGRIPAGGGPAAADGASLAAALDATGETVALYRPLFDDDGRFRDAELRFANAAAVRRWFPEGDLDALVGRPVFETLPFARPMLFELYRTTVETGVAYRGIHSADTPDGVRTFDISVTPFEGGIIHVGRDVTEEQATVRALRERTAELEEARDVAGLGVFRRDLQTGALAWSPQVFRIFGLDPKGPEPSAADVESLFTPESNRRRREIAEASLRDGLPWEVELEVRRPDGERRWVLQRGRPDVDADGRMTGYLGTLLDITDRRQAEEELRVAHDRLRRFLDAGIVGTFVADLGGRVLEANDYWLRLIGATREQLDRGELDWRALTEPQSGDADEPALAELRTRGTSLPYEEWYRLADGRRVPVLVVRAMMPGPEEQVASFVLDMTERRAALTGMARLVAAIEQTSESVVVTDVDANILYVNPAFERVSGYSFVEVRGQNPRILQSGAQTAADYAAMWGTLSAGLTWSGELVNRRKDGREYVEEASISPMRDELGQITAYVAVKRDITGERSLEAQLRQAQRLEAIGSLAGGVAHDFNNLLTAIRGYGELVLDALPRGSDSRADVTELLRAADRASALTRQLLAFSRRQVLTPEVLDPGAVIDELAPMLRRLLGAHIVLSTTRAADSGRVRADRGQLEQVVVNLAVNARDAMPGGGRLDVTAGNAQGPGGPIVRITVSDTGAGMDAPTLARVFEPFFTTKEEGKGTGMGLATVYGIVRQSNGTISVESARGSGTTFTIDLPRVEAPAGGGRGGPDAGGDPRAGGRGTPGQWILLVEDQDPVRAVAARILERQGYRVAQAASGAEALAVAAAAPEPFDLLLTDVRMPGMQGPEVARRLRLVQPGLRVLFMSGFAAEAAGDDGASLAGTTVIDKPFDAATLGRVVAAALGVAQ